MRKDIVVLMATPLKQLNEARKKPTKQNTEKNSKPSIYIPTDFHTQQKSPRRGFFGTAISKLI